MTACTPFVVGKIYGTEKRMDRRTFLKHSAEASAVFAILTHSSNLWGFDLQPARHEVTSDGAASDLAKYRSAVQKLKALPSKDPRNWTKLANIHNNHCPHQNWWFLPWHRAYLFYFEQICQDVLGDQTFRLPYWNWAKSNDVPAPFLDKSSSLFDPTREKSRVPAEVVSQKTVTSIVSSTSMIDLFSGATTSDQQRQASTAGHLEFGPHNGVHANLLGDMGNFMSPLDPIFWMHHCNIDRIWASWSKIAGNTQPSATLWNKHKLARFYDSASKKQVSPPASSTLSGKYVVPYDVYETSSGGGVTSPHVSELIVSSPHLQVKKPDSRVRLLEGQTKEIPPIALGSGAKISVPIPGDLKAFAGHASTAHAVSPQEQTESYLVIEDVPKPTSPTTALRAFINCASPAPGTSVDDPSYVGTLSFFGGDHAAMAGMGNSSFSVNITDVLRGRLRRTIRRGLRLRLGWCRLTFLRRSASRRKR